MSQTLKKFRGHIGLGLSVRYTFAYGEEWLKLES